MRTEAQDIIRRLIDDHQLITILLAAKLGVSEPTIRNYRDGVHEPKLPTLEKLRRILRGYESKQE